MTRSHQMLTTLIASAYAAISVAGYAYGTAATQSHEGNAGLFATDPGGANAAAKGPEGVAAEIDGHPILLRDIMRICLVKYRTPIVDQMVQNYVIDREASRKGIVVSDAQIDAQVETLRKSVAPTPLSDVISQHHSSMPEVRAAFRNKIERGLIVADQVPATNMAHCRAVLIKFASPGQPVSIAGVSRDEAGALTLTHALQAQISEGKDFGEIAAKYSDDSSKAESGDIGVLTPDMRGRDASMVAAALVLNKGQVSDPVRTEGGFWIVQAVTTAADHPQSESAAYKDARDTYVEQQSQFLSPQYVVDLIKKSHITFATDAECALEPGKPLPDAAANVDGHIIPMKDVVEKSMAQNGPNIVDILVQNALVAEECRRRKIVISDTEVDQRIEKLRTLIAPHTLDEGLAARHMTLTELKDNFRQDMERVRLVIDQTPSTKMARCRAILIKFQQPGESAHPGVSTRTEAQALARIQEIQKQLREGKDFGDLASQYSELEPKTNKGDLGVLYAGMHDMDTGVLNAGLALGSGKITTDPVKTVIGYCLVQSLSTGDVHPKEENASYTDALRVYKEQIAQTLIPDAVIALIKKSKVVYYLHAS